MDVRTKRSMKTASISHFRRLGPLLLAVAISFELFSTSVAFAEAEQIETDNEMLRLGLQLFEELEYERAVEVLSAALLQPGNSIRERLLIYRTLGTLYVFLDRQPEAELALRRVLCVDSDFEFGQYASPRIREVFDRVRQAWVSEGSPCEEQAPVQPVIAGPSRVVLDHDSPDSATSSEALELVVTVEDPEDQVSALTLYFRATGARQFNTAIASSTLPGTFVATIPGESVQHPAAEYYLQATNADGEPLATLGTARAPLRVPVSESGTTNGRTSIARRWWFWTIIGTVVVGTALGLGLWLGLRDDEPPPIVEPPPEEATLTITICDGESPSICFGP